MADRAELAIILEEDGSPLTPGPVVPGSPGAPGGWAHGLMLDETGQKIRQELDAIREAMAAGRAFAPGGGGSGKGPAVAGAEPDRLLERLRSLLDALGGRAGQAGQVMGGLQSAVGGAGGGGAAGAIVAGAVVAIGLIRQRIAEFKAAVDDAVSATRRLASNDNLGALTKAANSAAFALSNVPGAGIFLEASLKAAAGTANAFAGVVQAFVDRGKQLAMYSPQLALSGANAEITSQLADIREALELGPSLARLQDAQTELIDVVKEMLLPIKKWLVEVLASVMETLVANSGRIYAVGQQIVTLVQAIGTAMAALTVIPAVGEAIREAIKKGVEEFKKANDRTDVDEFFENMFSQLDMPDQFMPRRPIDPIFGNPNVPPNAFP